MEARSLQLLQHRSSLVALVIIAAVAWAFLLAGESSMATMRGDGLLMDLMYTLMKPGEAGAYLPAAIAMWLVMMIAMMVPAVLPMAAVLRGIDRGAATPFGTFVFAGGYLAGWSAFAVVAALLQWVMHASGVLHGHALAADARLAAGLLVLAGVYQLTPFKAACLARCRGPLSFFMEHWREGRAGAFAMGLRHGLYCIGCCWMLMLLMFAGGTMSVATMAALSIFILAERVLPAGPWVSRLPGLCLMAFGAVVFAYG